MAAWCCPWHRGQGWLKRLGCPLQAAQKVFGEMLSSQDCQWEGLGCHPTHLAGCWWSLCPVQAAFSGVPPEPPQHASLLWPTYPGLGAHFSILEQSWIFSGILTPCFLVAFVSRVVPDPPVLTGAVYHPLGVTLQRWHLSLALLSHPL